jgi:glycosidase
MRIPFKSLKIDKCFEFHISRQAREKYKFDKLLFALNGNVVFADLSAARQFAEKMTTVRGQTVPASDIYAMGLIDEIMHLLVRHQEKQTPGVMKHALESVGPDAEASLRTFIEFFPPREVYIQKLDAQNYLDHGTEDISNRVITLEEMLLLHITNQNPAVQNYKELFEEDPLILTSHYDQTIRLLLEFFSQQPGFQVGGSQDQQTFSLVEILLAPSHSAPHSLSAQLEYLLKTWGDILGENFVQRILRGLDYIKEDTLRGNFSGGFAGNIPPLSSSRQEFSEGERFSPDKEWMPRLVLIAKNSFVWLDQLSKKYRRPILHLDEIPEEELLLLQQRGINGLWLIGLWERSIASKRIKQMMGQEDAVASAYSLMDYEIAADLGGWGALQNLRWRAWQHGIRLSADMVPNHVGVDSRWVVEHPDWFISLPVSPYPAYSYTRADLSNDSRVAIQIEDHYFDRSDAAVVFKRVDHQTGDTRFIYHGNDGTSMPWNDTAQLDYTIPEVREAVIQTILHVARNFPIIRFDAAMTLARKHIQRLWYPAPGHGGAIPTRSEHGLTNEQFTAAMPNEFWREVVDRIAAEVPDTLLLAEAFWMMEGYFVRTLGMHRVYNSAFMHMLRDEDNAKYRKLLKDTLEFDPQILKRYVNFMNNPDEKSASEQFGTTEKYFGILTMMVTLPGLPMFGHGQIEGYQEKYGMEYRRAKWDESVDEDLVRGHEWRIFPLLHKRALFSSVENFRLYDFFSLDDTTSNPSGRVNEDVFAFSNQFANERSLVIYHNKHSETRGWIKISAAFLDKSSRKLNQQSLTDSLFLPDKGCIIMKDVVTGLEYIRSSRDLAEKGIYLDLGNYQCHVFLDWRFVSGEMWAQIHRDLHGAGTPSLQAKYDQLVALKQDVKVVPSRKQTKARKAPQNITADKPARIGVRKKKSGTNRKTGAVKKKST